MHRGTLHPHGWDDVPVRIAGIGAAYDLAVTPRSTRKTRIARARSVAGANQEDGVFDCKDGSFADKAALNGHATGVSRFEKPAAPQPDHRGSKTSHLGSAVGNSGSAVSYRASRARALGPCFSVGLSGTSADRGARREKPSPIPWQGAGPPRSGTPNQIRGMQGQRSLSRNGQLYW